MDIDIVKGLVVKSLCAQMVKFLILVGSSEYYVSFFAYSDYSLDNSENIDVDALCFELFELIFRFTKGRKG